MVEYETQEQAFNRKTFPTTSNWIRKQDELVQMGAENLYHHNCMTISHIQNSLQKIVTFFCFMFSCDMCINDEQFGTSFANFYVVEQNFVGKVPMTTMHILLFNAIMFHTLDAISMPCTFKLVAYLLARVHNNGEERIKCTSPILCV